jgi:hypothetical protein
MELSYITVERIKEERAKKQLKNAIWLYFWLLIFEGALRKWVLPGLASPLLIIRDPVAIWILLQAINHRFIKTNIYLIAMVVVISLAFILSLTVGHQNILVAFFGARIFLLHFPLIFIIANVFDVSDVIKMGKAMVWITPPMTVLIALQFYSPQTAWINRGIGDESTGGGFSGALGFFRPPATFSFISGTTLFFSLAGAYILYFWFNTTLIKKWLLIAATVSWVASIPLCISRTLFFQTAISVLFVFFAVSLKPKYAWRTVLIFVGIAIALVVLANTPTFQTFTAAFAERFSSANESEGGLHGVLVDRFLGGMIGALEDTYNQPFFGLGIGYGTNVGSQILTGETKFLISEEEWARIIGELGPLLGLTVILIRVGLTVSMARLSYTQMLRKGDILPWMLLSAGFLNVAQGQWSPPTILGFSVLVGGLIFACFKPAKT